MKNLQGSIVALVTPFDEDGAIDYASLDKLISFQLENGTDAILVNGTTGESPTITLEEFDRLTKHVVAKVSGTAAVIAGTGSNDTNQAVVKSQIAEKNGVDGLLIVSPYYNKPTRNGVLISKMSKLSSITIKLAQQSTEISGIYYYILKQLAWENISLVEVLSTTNEFTLIMEDSYVEQSISLLMNMKRG